MRFPDSRIGILTKAPIPGRCKTRLIPFLSSKQAAILQEQMAYHTIAMASRATLCPINIYYADEHPFFHRCQSEFKTSLSPQVGKDLGERIMCAIGMMLEYSQAAIVIGTDSPVMTCEYLQQALEILQRGLHDVVIGPAEDGGYVLIGMRYCYQELFRDIPWQSDQVYAKTLTKIEQLKLEFYSLPTLWDVDTPDDIKRLRELGMFSSLLER